MYSVSFGIHCDLVHQKILFTKIIHLRKVCNKFQPSSESTGLTEHSVFFSVSCLKSVEVQKTKKGVFFDNDFYSVFLIRSSVYFACDFLPSLVFHSNRCETQRKSRIGTQSIQRRFRVCFFRFRSFGTPVHNRFLSLNTFTIGFFSVHFRSSLDGCQCMIWNRVMRNLWL